MRQCVRFVFMTKQTLCMAGILTLLVPAFGRSLTDIPYGDHALQRPDLYVPNSASNAPVMVYVHGGGWKVGDKRSTGRKAAFFNDRGWIFISANYRLLPDGRHPENVNDVAKAIAWTHDRIATHGGDPDRIFIMGHSAGAHLAALVATDGRPLKKAGGDLAIIRGVIALDTCAYDVPKQAVESKSALYADVFSGDVDRQRDASPIHHVAKDKGIPPFLICYSRGMGLRPNPARPVQAHAFASALNKAGIHASVVDASDRSHGEINQWFGREDDEKVTGAAARFLDGILQSGRRKVTSGPG